MVESASDHNNDVYQGFQPEAALLQSLAAGSESWIFAKDRNFRFLFVTHSLAMALGIESADILGKTDIDLGFPNELIFGDPAKGIRGFRTDDEAVLTGQTLHNPYDPVTVADGSKRVLDTKKFPLRDSHGNIMGIIGVSIDVTALHESRRRLTEAQELLQLVLDVTPMPMFWKDRQSVYLGCNQEFARIAGLASPMEIVGKTDYDLPWKKEESDFFQECDRKVMASAQAEIGIIETQLQANGTETWVETNKVPMHSPEGNVIGILGSYQNITQRIEAQQSLQQQKETLEQTLSQLQQAQTQLIQGEKMSALGNLIAGIAHEINNPLASLKGNTQVALNYINDLFSLIACYQNAYPNPATTVVEENEAMDFEFVRQDFPKLMTSMSDAAKRIEVISNSLRTFSRSDNNYPVLFKLQDGVESTLLILKHRLKANEQRPAIEVVRQYSDLPQVKCYAGQLNQVFMNLLSNAVDALETHQAGKIVISTALGSDQRTAVVKINDNGVGMDDEVKAKAFNHLFTTKPVGKGTGLGLTIAKQIIIDKHQGQLDFTSTWGQGTSFVITLPLVMPPQASSTPGGPQLGLD